MRPLDDAAGSRRTSVPSNVARAVCERWPDRGPAWCAAVDAELAALCRRHGARPVKVLDARFALVVAAEPAVGVALALKFTADPAGPLQARAAERLADLHVGPTVHEVAESDVGTSIVMDLVRPGTPGIDAPLKDLVEVLRPLAVSVAPPANLPRLSEWLRPRLADGYPADRAVGSQQTPLPTRQRALELLDELASDEAAEMCHGDTSPGNILRGQGGLNLVDPRGVSGDVEYDIAVVSSKSGHDLTTLTKFLSRDVERAHMWAQVAMAALV